MSRSVLMVTIVIIIGLTLFYKETSGLRRGVVETKLTGVKCNDSLSLTVVNTTCSLKSYSRNNTVLNLKTYIIRQLNSSSMKMRLVVYFRMRTAYKKWMDVTIEDLCSIVDSKQNLIFERIIGAQLRRDAPGLFHPCPYKGLLSFTNLSMQTENKHLDFMWPKGDYRSEMYILDDFDANLFKISILQAVNSDLDM